MMLNVAVLNFLPEYFRSADEAAIALSGSIDLEGATLLGGYIVFDYRLNHYRISRPVSFAQAEGIEFNERGYLNGYPTLRLRGSYCTSDMDGARRMAFESGERALYSHFFAPAYLARMINQDLAVRASAGYWLAPDKAVLKFRSHAEEEAKDLVSQAPDILNTLIDGTRSMVAYIQQVAQAGDLQVLQRSEFPGIWDTLGIVPGDWLQPVQSN